MHTKPRDLPGIAAPLLEDGRYRPALERQPVNALTHMPRYPHPINVHRIGEN